MFEKVVGTFVSIGYAVETLFEGRPNLYRISIWISNAPCSYFHRIIVDDEGRLTSHNSACDSKEEKRMFRIFKDSK